MAAKLHINDLPMEMLGYILDFLSFGERKLVALVCQRWNSEAFSPGFIDRVLFRVFPNDLSAVCASVRVYRHMKICNLFKRDWSMILPVLEKFGSELYSLHMVFYSTPQLWDIYWKTPHLKRLTLEASCYELIFEAEFLPRWTEVKEFTILYNSSDELGIEFLSLTPNMSSVTIEWRSGSYLTDALEALECEAPQLTYLDIGEIRSDYDESTLQHFFTLATELKTALLRFPISHQTLRVIAKNCSHLQMLLICINKLQTTELSCLDALTELKVLRIRSEHLLHSKKVSHKALPNVETFCLELTKNPSISAIEYLSKRLPNIRTLKVMIGDSSEKMDTAILNQICYNFRRLKILTVNDRSYSNALPMDSFQQLRFLHRLEELNLTNVELSISKLPPTNIRRLRLNRCKFGANELENIALALPCLRYLGIRSSNFVKKENISAAAHALPNCVVECNDNYLYHQVKCIFGMEL